MSIQLFRVEMLGTLRIILGDRLLDMRRFRKSGALLALLLLQPKNGIDREELAEYLSPNEDPDVSRNRLRVLLSTLKQQTRGFGIEMDALIRVERHKVSLATNIQTDYNEFCECVAVAEKSQSLLHQIELWERAVMLYYGDLLPGFDEEPIRIARNALTETHYQMLLRLTRALIETGKHERALLYAQKAVTLEPLDEEAHKILVSIYIHLGQNMVALKHYSHVSQLFQTELGIEPSIEIQQKIDQLRNSLNKDWNDDKELVLLIQQNNQSISHLPPRLTRFFGREVEIESICSSLSPQSRVRLLTLKGTGGIGKTRLALEAADQLRDVYCNRVWFIPLMDISDPERICEVISNSLNSLPCKNSSEFNQIYQILRDDPCLLVLDNMEQLLPGSTSVLNQLLATVPNLKLLITSRREVTIEGARTLPLAPLSMNKEDGANLAVSLFADRASMVSPDFIVTEGNLDFVEQICQKLEGLPLAIELAAAKIRILKPEEMTLHLNKNTQWMSDNLGIKTTRHKSLDTTIHWSYQLLNHNLQDVFRKLSVFSGGFTADALSRVLYAGVHNWDNTVQTIEQLYSDSLIVAEEGDSGSTRYRMLESLREFALERLKESGKEQEARTQHLQWAHRLSIDAARGLVSNAHVWLQRLDNERDNLRSAVEFGCSEGGNSAVIALQITSNIHRYWTFRLSNKVGINQIKLALSKAFGADDASIAEAHLALGWLYEQQGELKQGEESVNTAIALFTKHNRMGRVAYCNIELGRLAVISNNPMDAINPLSAALSYFKGVADSEGEARTLSSLSYLDYLVGHNTNAISKREEALAIYKHLGDSFGVAVSLQFIGCIEHLIGKIELGTIHLEEAQQIHHTLGNRQGVVDCIHNLSYTYCHTGKHQISRQMFESAIPVYQELGNVSELANCIHNMGYTRVRSGNLDEAEEILGEAFRLAQSADSEFVLARCHLSFSILDLLKGDLTKAGIQCKVSRELFQKLDHNRGIALCQHQAALLSHADGKYDEAVGLYAEAVVLHQSMGEIAMMLDDFEGICYSLHDLNFAMEAACLYALNSAMREKVGTETPIWFRDGLGSDRYENYLNVFRQEWMQVKNTIQASYNLLEYYQKVVKPLLSSVQNSV